LAVAGQVVVGLAEAGRRQVRRVHQRLATIHRCSK
jgi:hypothetical protein